MNKLSNNIIVYVSVLNWNKAQSTLICLDHLLRTNKSINLKMKIFIVDNGSTQDDWICLSEGVKHCPITLIRLEQNLGFSGGHNIVMQQAINDKADYIWLVNNDGITLPETLPRMIELAETDPSCGAVSPLIVSQNDEQIDFCGAYHDWKNLIAVRFDRKMDEIIINADEKSLWLVGAAVLFRVKALKAVGLLDDSFFAYFEDNDICAKLAFSGWKNRVAVNARFQHDLPTERPPYFYYLMARNEFLFWLRHTPKQYRHFILLRLLERSVFRANQLLFTGKSTIKSDASLLGCLDGVLGRGGQPKLNRKIPWYMVLIRKARWPFHVRHIKEQARNKL